MQAHGGFDHNAQSLRIVTRLERHYASFDGLNLTWETLEGLVKHNGPLIDAEGHAVRHYREKGVPQAIIEYNEVHDLALASYASAEAQVAAIADDIAYNAHDIDDGLRAGLFDVIDLGDVPLAGQALAEVLRLHPDLERPRLVHETVRRVIAAMVGDVLAETELRVGRNKPACADDVRSLGEALVAFSAGMQEKNRVLQAFLSRRMYDHERVLMIMERAGRLIVDLFQAYMEKIDLLPRQWRHELHGERDAHYARRVCDFIAGMTDRYALDEHKRLFDLDPLFR
jgi:dGTPase